MAFILALSLPDRNVYTALAADTKDVANASPTDTCFETDTGDEYKFNGAEWKKIGTTTSSGEAAGLMVVDGLANNAIRQSAGTYSSTVILGFRILNVGTGDLTYTPNTSGATPILVTAAELTLMGINAYNDWPIAASSITAGTGMELLVYIP